MPNNEFGDFQTPLELARRCLTILSIPPDSQVFEPTCGLGAFLEAAAEIVPRSKRVGVEINPDYAEVAKRWAAVHNGSIFEVEMASLMPVDTMKPLYVVGNPPWVTSAELKRMDSKNLPPKENFKGVNGLQALLGSSNFDVSEFIILKALREFSTFAVILGMLCKTQVARNVMEFAAKVKIPVVRSSIYRIDAMRWFGAGVDACWFVVEVNQGVQGDYTTHVYDDLFAEELIPSSRFGVVDGQLVSDVDRYLAARRADSKSPYVWRSGLKHDASRVFELIATPLPQTKNGELLDLETDYLLPFLKGTDVYHARHRSLSKWVIVPQREFGADTSHLRVTAPKLWAYLMSHADILDGRKSSIYKNRPRFSVFGHGAYTYAPYKVVISALHKEPVFRLVAPINGQPVVVDDTCYLLPFEDPLEACVVAAILNSPECLSLISSLSFQDAKRPITKKLLSRIDMNRLDVDVNAVLTQARRLAEEANLAFDEDRGCDFIGHLGEKPTMEEVLF